ncbi:MAG: maleylpyruvate isomerase N-terminal domain-containing protein [Acidimicrobiales bacterium]
MSEVLERYRRVAGVRSDQWELQTPCTDWTVVAHVVGVQPRVLANVTGDEGERWPAVAGRMVGRPADPVRAASSPSSCS